MPQTLFDTSIYNLWPFKILSIALSVLFLFGTGCADMDQKYWEKKIYKVCMKEDRNWEPAEGEIEFYCRCVSQGVHTNQEVLELFEKNDKGFKAAVLDLLVENWGKSLIDLDKKIGESFTREVYSGYWLLRGAVVPECLVKTNHTFYPEDKGPVSINLVEDQEALE